MTEPARPLVSSAAGLVIGAVILVALTALLTAAVASNDANAKLDRLPAITSRLERVTADLNAFRDEQETRTAASSARGKLLIKQNEELLRKNAQMRRQFNALVKMLREQGIAVPPPSPPPELSPKGQSGSGPTKPPKPSPSAAPGSPAPTSPSPASPSSPVCVLLPPLCPKE